MSDIVVVVDAPAAETVEVPSGGYSGFGDVYLTPDGGVAVRYINGTGAPTVAGQVVRVSGERTVNLAQVGIPDPIGVFFQSGVPAGEYAWVVVSGVAKVLFASGTTAGHLARTFVNAEAGAVAGKALSEAAPTSPFATDKHFCEIGHVIESRTGEGLALVNLHFN